MEQKDSKYCVYKHENLINKKVYIGITCNIEKRFAGKGRNYKQKNKDGKYTQPAFANALNKYGWDNFSHEILEENLTLEQAWEKEIYYIALYDSTNKEKGYNIDKGGNGGWRMTEEGKRKIGEKNKIYSQKRDISGKNNPMYGKILTEKERWNRGKAMRGKKMSEEQKKKISESNKKFYQTHEHHCKGTHKTEEQKEHMRELMTGRVFTDEHRINVGKAHSKYVYICVETRKEYYSSGEAMRNTGIDKASIRRAADGIQKTAGGFHWTKREKTDEQKKENE